MRRPSQPGAAGSGIAPVRVALVHPPEPEGRVVAEVLPSYSLGYVARALLDQGHDVEMIDLRIDALSPAAFAERLRARATEIVGFTAFSIHLERVEEYAAAVREALPLVRLVVGGPHAILEPAETLRRIPAVDFVCCGEGEIMLPALIRALREGRDDLTPIPNLAWRRGGGVVVNRMAYVEDLDRCPRPAWEIMALDRFPKNPHGLFSRHGRVAPVIATRGCPYPCSYCAAARVSGKKIRKRSIDSVIAEVELLRDRWGVREIQFEDSNLTQDGAHAKALFREMIRRRGGIAWSCPGGLRPGTLDRELLELMEASGCYSVAVAIESGSQRVLDELLRRHMSLDLVREQLRLIRAHTRIRVTGFFIVGIPGMFGLPAESRDELRETIRFACTAALDRAAFFVFTPYPGSAKHAEIVGSRGAAGLPCGSMDLHCANELFDDVDPAYVRRALLGAYARFYLRPSILLRVLGEIRSLDQARTLWRRAASLILPRAVHAARAPRRAEATRRSAAADPDGRVISAHEGPGGGSAA